MILSAKTYRLKAEGAYAVLNKAGGLEKKGKKIVHFEIGQPDFPTPKKIIDSAIESIKSGKTKYISPLGLEELKEEIAKNYQKRTGVKTSSSQIVVTPGAKAAIFLAMIALLEPGDEVIYPDPGFPTYSILVEFLGAKKKPAPILEKNGFSVDLTKLKKTITKKTKLIILNSPSNPTGSTINNKDLKELTEFIKQKTIWLISDEIYSQIIFDNIKYRSLLTFPHTKDKTIVIDGFSKTYAMTGWRLGYLIIPKGMTAQFDYLLTHTVGCTASFTQYAAVDGLRESESDVKKMVTEFEKRRDFVVERLNSIAGIKCHKPEGAFYVFPNIKSFGYSSDYLADYILNEAGVALLSGSSFGKYGEGYLRISYATSMELLKEGLDKMEKALKKLKIKNK